MKVNILFKEGNPFGEVELDGVISYMSGSWGIQFKMPFKTVIYPLDSIIKIKTDERTVAFNEGTAR